MIGDRNDSSQLLLAIESSCDETAAAVVDRGLNVHSNIVASQTELHLKYGGVVPEIASRAHVQRILPVIEQALSDANTRLEDLSAIAVMTQPGLVGSLLVGLTAAKTLALVTGLPLVAVNHIEAHIYACRMAAGRELFPAIGFVVSGGHTNFYDCPEPVGFQLLGSTIDDAAGEAFDKVAKLLELPYPGGPSIEKIAQKGDPKAVKLPRPMIRDESLNVSFSGLKTAVLYQALGMPGPDKPPAPELTEQRKANLAASFQAATVDVLTAKCRLALTRYNRNRLCVGGGVAANKALRQSLEQLCDELNAELILAPFEFCTDNAAMAGIAWESLDRGQIASLDLDVTPGLVRL